MKLKKAIGFILVFVIVFALLSSCSGNTNTTDNENTTTNENTAPEPNIPDDPSTDNPSDPTAMGLHNYDSILKMYQKTVEIRFSDSSEYTSMLEAMCEELNISDTEEKDMCEEVFYAVLSNGLYEDGETKKSSFGYAIKDLNGNGSNELILLLDNYTVLAIFTTVDDKPMLFDSFWSKYKCYLDSQGNFYINSTGGASYSYIYKYNLSSGDNEYILLEEFGNDGYDDEKGEGIYYKLVSGERVDITEEDFLEIFSNYYLSYNKAAEYTKSNAGLEFISLFDKKEVYTLTATADCYIRTSTEITDSNAIRNSDGARVVLRKGNTVRLLQWETVSGSEYTSGNTKRSDWYKIEYDGKIRYVTADSFERSGAWVSEEDYIPTLLEKIFLPQKYHLGLWYTDKYKLDYITVTEVTDSTVKFELSFYRLASYTVVAEFTADGIVFDDKTGGISGTIEFTENIITVYIDKSNYINKTTFVYNIRPRTVTLKADTDSISVYNFFKTEVLGEFFNNSKVFLLHETSIDDEWYIVDGISTFGKYIRGYIKAECLYDSEKVTAEEPLKLRETLTELVQSGLTYEEFKTLYPDYKVIDDEPLTGDYIAVKSDSLPSAKITFAKKNSVYYLKWVSADAYIMLPEYIGLIRDDFIELGVVFHDFSSVTNSYFFFEDFYYNIDFWVGNRLNSDTCISIGLYDEDFQKPSQILEYEEFFGDYGAIINIYRAIVKSYDFDTAECHGLIMPFEGESKYNFLFSEIYKNIIYLGDYKALLQGYIITDLNSDGFDELILLNDDETILAIITNYNNELTLLDSVWIRYYINLDADGKVYTSVRYAAAESVFCIYDISQNEYVFLYEFGFYPEESDIIYYKMNQINKIVISEAEFYNLAASFYKAKIESSGFEFIPLFD